jgi:RNA polymerase sigma factor (TIGR02999 family)
MNEVTRILTSLGRDEPESAVRLLPLVYDELRKLAAQRLARESKEYTLDATGLVHEAYLRLVDPEAVISWDHRGHFFAAAAEAMRRILVERARRRARVKHGGHAQRVELRDSDHPSTSSPDEIIAVDDALDRLAIEDPTAASLVKLRYFAGLSVEDAAQSLGISRATAYRLWTYARAWVRRTILDA